MSNNKDDFLKSVTIGEFIQWLSPDIFNSAYPLLWPPDAFAIAASILQKSGAYTFVVGPVKYWPPGKNKGERDNWANNMRRIGNLWRRNFKHQEKLPFEVKKWWSIIKSKKNVNVELINIRDHPKLCEALLQLCAAADEASAGVGLLPLEEKSSNDHDDFYTESKEYLMTTSHNQNKSGATLSKEINSWKVRVLPKQHTPQSGLTFRSLSHHLSLCPPAYDVIPHWHIVPSPSRKERPYGINILLLPWPLEILPVQFKPANPPTGKLPSMPKNYGFFRYEPRDDWLKGKSIAERAIETLECAKEKVGRIDMVVLPEMAVKPKEYVKLRKVLVEERNLILICGVTECKGNSDGKNYAKFSYLFFKLSPSQYKSRMKQLYVQLCQEKHHRWRLDRRQITQYGLGSSLDPTKDWWESISLKKRSVNFVTIYNWLTVCVLICEDLARQDPVSEVVRSIGPNLVIALLFDGPQISKRWPAQYASILADDPGSSVLTLTNAGMVDLSNPPPGESRSRAIALWKDARSKGAQEIELPKGAKGIVLSITKEIGEEFTADGRTDGGVSSYPFLSAIHNGCN